MVTEQSSEPQLAERLARVMRDRGWTQLQIARKAGVSEAMVSRALNATHEQALRLDIHGRLDRVIDALASSDPGASLTKAETEAALALLLVSHGTPPEKIKKLVGRDVRQLRNDLKTAQMKLRAHDQAGLIVKVSDELSQRTSEVLHSGALRKVTAAYLDDQSDQLIRRLRDVMNRTRNPRLDVLHELADAALPHDDERRREWIDRFRWWAFANNETVRRVRKRVRENFIAFVAKQIRVLQKAGYLRRDRSPREIAIESIRLVDSLAIEEVGLPDEETRAYEQKQLGAYFAGLKMQDPEASR